MKVALVVALLSLLAVACVPRFEPAGPSVMAPRLDGEGVVMPDGAELPLRSWLPEGNTRAVVIALHGMNDYSNAFEAAGKQLATAGIAVYAYDQRGFGQSPHVGRWAGMETMANDLKTVRAVIGSRHPGLPMYLLGESMGGAVAIVARTDPEPVAADGLILVAPAVWGRTNMNIFEKVGLFLTAHTVPWMHLSAAAQICSGGFRLSGRHLRRAATTSDDTASEPIRYAPRTITALTTCEVSPPLMVTRSASTT